MKIAKYILSVLFIIGGLGMAAENSILSGICLIVLGISLFPVVSDKLKEAIKLWNKKGVRYGSYALLFILVGAFGGEMKETSSSIYKKNNKQSNYQPYLDKVTANVNSLMEDRKVSRQNMVDKLQATETYKILVTNQIVSVEYLPLLTAVNNGLRRSYIDEENEELIAIEQSLANRVKNATNGKDKLDFVIKVIVLSTPNKGGYSKELVEVFERYRKKYGLYGAPKKVYSTSGEKEKNIEHAYNMSAIFYHINPNNNALNAIYEANTKGVGNWFKNSKGQKYIYEYLATKKGYLEYAKQINPNSPYVLKVDKEVWAEDLYNLYEANEVLADEKYKGKKLAITGTIAKISKNFTGAPYIVLKVDFLKSVQCEFDDKYLKEISKLRKGQKIIIIGECRGLILSSVMIDDCEIWNE